MSLPICGLSSSVRLALVALDSTSDVLSTADSNLDKERDGALIHEGRTVHMKDAEGSSTAQPGIKHSLQVLLPCVDGCDPPPV